MSETGDKAEPLDLIQSADKRLYSTVDKENLPNNTEDGDAGNDDINRDSAVAANDKNAPLFPNSHQDNNDIHPESKLSGETLSTTPESTNDSKSISECDLPKNSESKPSGETLSTTPESTNDSKSISECDLPQNSESKLSGETLSTNPESTNESESISERDSPPKVSNSSVVSEVSADQMLKEVGTESTSQAENSEENTVVGTDMDTVKETDTGTETKSDLKSEEENTKISVVATDDVICTESKPDSPENVNNTINNPNFRPECESIGDNANKCADEMINVTDTELTSKTSLDTNTEEPRLSPEPIEGQSDDNSVDVINETNEVSESDDNSVDIIDETNEVSESELKSIEGNTDTHLAVVDETDANRESMLHSENDGKSVDNNADTNDNTIADKSIDTINETNADPELEPGSKSAEENTDASAESNYDSESKSDSKTMEESTDQPVDDSCETDPDAESRSDNGKESDADINHQLDSDPESKSDSEITEETRKLRSSFVHTVHETTSDSESGSESEADEENYKKSPPKKPKKSSVKMLVPVINPTPLSIPPEVAKQLLVANHGIPRKRKLIRPKSAETGKRRSLGNTPIILLDKEPAIRLSKVKKARKIESIDIEIVQPPHKSGEKHPKIKISDGRDLKSRKRTQSGQDKPRKRKLERPVSHDSNVGSKRRMSHDSSGSDKRGASHGTGKRPAVRANSPDIPHDKTSDSRKSNISPKDNSPDIVNKSDEFYDIKRIILHSTYGSNGANMSHYQTLSNVLLRNWRFSKQFPQAMNRRARQNIHNLMNKIVRDLYDSDLIEIRGPENDLRVVDMIMEEIKSDNTKLFSHTPPSLTILITEALFNKYFTSDSTSISSSKMKAVKSVSLGNSTEQWFKLKTELGVESHSDLTSLLIHCYKAWNSIACGRCRRHMEIGMEQKINKNINGTSSICIVSCECGQSTSGGFMIECDSCHKWQHGVCVDVSNDQIPDQYSCKRCRNILTSSVIEEDVEMDAKSEASVVSIDNTEVYSDYDDEPEVIELD